MAACWDASAIVLAGSKVATVIGTLAVLVVCSGVVAYVVARHYGRSRTARKAIFSLAAGACLLASAFAMRTILR
jgi:hypothetical protein